MRGAECSIVEARGRKPMSLGLVGLHQGSEHRFRSRVAATFRMLFREVASRHPSALVLAFCPDLDRACSETGDGGRRGAVLGVRGGLFWQWACGASPVLVTGVTLREPRMDIWQWSQVFAEKIGRVGCAWLRFVFFCGPSRRALCLLAYVSRTRVYAMPKTSAKATKKRKQDASNFKTYIARARTRGACGGAREGAACCTILDRCVRRAGAVGRSGAVVVCRDRVHGAH